MTETPRDQPSNVSTEDTLQIPDRAVVTSDTAVPEPQEADQKDPKAAASESAGSKDQEPAPDKPKPTRNRAAERRIKKLSAKLSDSERRDLGNQQKIINLQKQVDKLTSAIPKPAEPQIDDYTDPREYAKEYSKWEASTSKPANPVADTPPPVAPTPAQEIDPVIADFHKRGQEKLGDSFIEAMSQTDSAVNQTMGDYIIDSDVGPELYVHLVNNPDEAREIYDSSGYKAVKMLEALSEKAGNGELDVGEGALDIQDPEPKPTEKRSATKAPKPPSSTKGEGAVSLKVNPENESMDDYARRRKKEMAEKAGHIF